MNQKIKDLLADKNFWEELGQKLVEQQAQERAIRSQFTQSATFSAMVQSMIEASELRVLDNETFAYFPEETKKRLGWEHHQDNDIELFMDVMQHADGLDKKLRQADEACIFENERFEFHGLFVFLMWGQGMSLTIRNQKMEHHD